MSKPPKLLLRDHTTDLQGKKLGLDSGGNTGTHRFDVATTAVNETPIIPPLTYTTNDKTPVLDSATILSSSSHLPSSSSPLKQQQVNHHQIGDNDRRRSGTDLVPYDDAMSNTATSPRPYSFVDSPTVEHHNYLPFDRNNSNLMQQTHTLNEATSAPVTKSWLSLKDQISTTPPRNMESTIIRMNSLERGIHYFSNKKIEKATEKSNQSINR